MFNNLSFRFLILFICCQSSHILNAQEQVNNSNVEHNDSLHTKYYTRLSTGITTPIYRDFATSPLFFSGIGLNLSTAWLKHSDSRERIFQLEMGGAVMSPNTPESDFIQTGGLSFFGQFNAFYQQLWKLEALSNTQNNIKVGGALVTTQNIRINGALVNNLLGLESIYNLMASAQITRDISRKKEKEINLLLFKPVLKPAKRDLRFLFNVGVLNVNHRPGYTYTYNSEMNGTETGPAAWTYYNYQWALNGWRLQTQLEYIKHLPNGNARSWSYVWRAAHVPGRHEAFQMASHQIQFTLFFNSKKRKS